METPHTSEGVRSVLHTYKEGTIQLSDVRTWMDAFNWRGKESEETKQVNPQLLVVMGRFELLFSGLDDGVTEGGNLDEGLERIEEYINDIVDKDIDLPKTS